MIQCELDLTPTQFCYTKIIMYEIELPPSGKRIGFNLLDGEYFTIPYVTDTIPNSPAGHQIPKKSKKIFVSLLSMENSFLRLKARYMILIAIKLRM